MKNNIKLSQKTGVDFRVVYTISGILILAACSFVIYLNLGRAHNAFAAEGDGTCGIIISSEEVGYNANFQPYKIIIEAEILNVIPNRANCKNGYNFNIEVGYNISFEGPGNPNINTLQGNIVCDNYNLWFNFPNNVRNNGGTGTFTTTVNQWRNVTDCDTVTPETLGCTAITITISGEGIPAQSNLACPSNTLLPISLVDFYAKKTNQGVLIQWLTDSEENNDFFTVERSNDGRIFTSIAEVDGAGDSNEKREYKFEDLNPSSGMNYYRLKQTDYNGDFEYFKIIGVNNENHSMQATSPIIRELYPNPLNGEVSINFETANAGSLELTIQNIQGETKLRKTLTAAKGANTFKVNNLDQLQPGVYFLRLNLGEQFSEPHRIIKL